MNLLTLIMQAIFSRSATFATTVGSAHFAVSITMNAVAGHTGNLWDILLVVAQIRSGKPGVFTVGVFTVTITQLQAA